MSEQISEDYSYQGAWDGYEVYTSYAAEGPNREEALALYREALSDSLYLKLAEQALQYEEIGKTCEK